MSTTVFVVSDLHLGGGEGFQMCGRQGQAKLAALLRWIAGHGGGESQVHLVGQPPNALDGVIQVPRVAAFTGHRIDEDPALRRFPVEAIPRVAEAIGHALDEHHIHFGYASAASGADLLFLEALLEREGEAHIFLPFPAEHFLRTSVGPLWRPRFEAVLERVGPERTIVLSNAPPGEDADLQYARCNEAIQQAALAEAALLGDRALLIAVLAGGEGKPGGTADMVRSWMAHPGAGEVIRIDPSAGPPIGDVLAPRPAGAASAAGAP